MKNEMIFLNDLLENEYFELYRIEIKKDSILIECKNKGDFETIESCEKPKTELENIIKTLIENNYRQVA